MESGGDVLEALDEVGWLHPKNDTFPGEVFVRLGAGALAVGGVNADRPIAEEGLIGRYLPECRFRGRDNHKIRYALLAVAATHSGVEVEWPRRGRLLGDRRLLEVCRPSGGGVDPGGLRPAGSGGARPVPAATGAARRAGRVASRCWSFTPPKKLHHRARPSPPIARGSPPPGWGTGTPWPCSGGPRRPCG